MDGIEVVDSTIVDFFAEMEKENFIYLDDDVEISKVRDLLEEEKHDFNEDVLNVNHYIFDQEEWKDRIKRKFSNRKKEYHDNKKLIK